jgi:hypothetical protein
MTDSESDAAPDEPRRPKRGAFPTPKSEIEKAKQYVPDVSDVDDERHTHGDVGDHWSTLESTARRSTCRH